MKLILFILSQIERSLIYNSFGAFWCTVENARTSQRQKEFHHHVFYLIYSYSRKDHNSIFIFFICHPKKSDSTLLPASAIPTPSSPR